MGRYFALIFSPMYTINLLKLYVFLSAFRIVTKIGDEICYARLRARLRASSRLPLGLCPRSLIQGADVKIWGEKLQICLKAGKISDTLHEDLSTFYCCRRHEIAIKRSVLKSAFFFVVSGC
jgi:hypothetical protein